MNSCFIHIFKSKFLMLPSAIFFFKVMITHLVWCITHSYFKLNQVFFTLNIIVFSSHHLYRIFSLKKNCSFQLLKIFRYYFSFFSYLLRENKLVHTNIQALLRYLLVLYKYLLRHFCCLCIFLISFGTYSTLKLSKYVTLSLFTCKSIQLDPIDLYSSTFITSFRF